MTKFADPQGDFGNELCEALGLKGRAIESITIRAKAGELVQVRITEHMREQEGQEFTRLTRRYTLQPL